MKDSYVRAKLFEAQIKYKRERDALVKSALESDVYEEKDEFYRRAAVFGIRLDAISQIIDQISSPNCTDLTRARAYQKYNRDMQRLVYRARDPNGTHDALDNEVISQFYNDGIRINEKAGLKFGNAIKM